MLTATPSIGGLGCVENRTGNERETLGIVGLQRGVRRDEIMVTYTKDYTSWEISSFKVTASFANMFSPMD